MLCQAVHSKCEQRRCAHRGGDTVGKRGVAEECMSPARPAAMYSCPDSMVPAI